MKYDDMLRTIGGFGKYQKRVIFLMFLSFIPNGIFTMLSVFIFDMPEHHCKITINKNDTNYSDAVNQSIPMVENRNGDIIRSECTKYASNESPIFAMNRSLVTCDNGWEYFPKYEETTASMEWNLVCNRAWIKPFSMSCYMTGMLIGGIIGGGLSDRFGRRPMFLIGFAMQFAANFFAGFSTGPFLLTFFLFLSGVSAPINYVGGFVLGTEVIVSSKRAFYGFITAFGYAVGYMILPPLAYFLTDWRWLMFCVGGTGFLFIPYYWLVPESPRWLIMNGKPEAEELIQKIAKVNRRNIEKLDLSTLKSCRMEEVEANEITKRFTYLDLFRNAIIRTRTLILFVVWFSCITAYYGISYGTSDLGGNKFINAFISAAVEVPGNVFVCFLINKFGRRSVLTLCYVIGGLCCILITFFRQVDETLMISSAMVGKFLMTGVVTCIYIYSCELYPTKMRQMGMGALFSFARLGSISAPYLIFAGERVVSITMGSVALISGLLILRLPETAHSKLPDTLEDVAKQEKYKLRCRKLQEDDISDLEEKFTEKL